MDFPFSLKNIYGKKYGIERGLADVVLVSTLNYYSPQPTFSTVAISSDHCKNNRSIKYECRIINIPCQIAREDDKHPIIFRSFISGEKYLFFSVVDELVNFMPGPQKPHQQLVTLFVTYRNARH